MNDPWKLLWNLFEKIALSAIRCRSQGCGCFYAPSLKLTVRPWKSPSFLVNTIKMVDFPWRTVSLQEGTFFLRLRRFSDCGFLTPNAGGQRWIRDDESERTGSDWKLTLPLAHRIGWNSQKFTLTQRIHGTGIFAYNHKNQLNVGKYTIHGSYG